MVELIKPTLHNTYDFLYKQGLQVNQYDFLHTYPGVFRERRVVRVYDKKKREIRVLKARPRDREAEREIHSMNAIMATYRFSGGHFNSPTVETLEKYVILNMPFLGYDLGELAQDLSLKSLGYDPETQFTGLSFDTINQLCSQLPRDHIQFARNTQLIHGDLWQKSPNNVVYHQGINKLLLIDAEALNTVDESATSRFNDQLNLVQEWMHSNLLLA